MHANCAECVRLKQASDDAIRVETMMLAQKFLASSNGYDTRLPKMIALLREASELRRQARYALSRHSAEHDDGRTITFAHENDPTRMMGKRMAGSN